MNSIWTYEITTGSKNSIATEKISGDTLANGKRYYKKQNDAVTTNTTTNYYRRSNDTVYLLDFDFKKEVVALVELPGSHWTAVTSNGTGSLSGSYDVVDYNVAHVVGGTQYLNVLHVRENSVYVSPAGDSTKITGDV